MLHVATCLWDANAQSLPFSRCYDETWVEKLYRGFARNLSVPFRFVVFTDRTRTFSAPIAQEPLSNVSPSYANFTEPFRLDEPMILVGLDTVIVGNIDHLALYCLQGGMLALPRNPKKPEVSCNGVALVPPGSRAIFDEWRGENDMEWVIGRPHASIDSLFPGQVRSYKVQVRRDGLGDARIVYFHGDPKMPALPRNDPVLSHWR